ncbi:Clr5 domain-containing protein [Trichoderma simmonsii]|uniref:Clr5 domain-containing protein n=1 Tax=Trichoderma simmonsii TaxID=1491479 RepID=A0A8G0PI00_9HYPO|nr:Clr5 domain-containing protein [Trichoderma simmonsii]
MASQPPDNFDNNLDEYDLNTIASQASGDTGLDDTGMATTQWPTGDDPMIFFANLQYPTFGNEYLAPNTWAPPPSPGHPADIAGSLNEVGSQFGNQLAGDVSYASPEAFSTAVDGAQDTPSSIPTNAPATAGQQPPNQRRPRARPPSPKAWKEKKTAIYSFYMEQELTLRTTMQLMQIHHQFQATEKMYKAKFRQWKWSKNLPRAIAGRMLDVGNERLPKLTVFWRNNQEWSMEEIKKRRSKHSAQGNSSLQDNSSIPDDFTYGTPPSSGITDTESVLDNDAATADTESVLDNDAATADTTEDLLKFLVEGRCRTNSTPEELYSRAREAVKAAEAGTCNHEEAESALKDAFSYFRHHFSPTHSKTVEIGYFLVSFYVKLGRVNDAHCILDWMTNEHCADAKSYGTVTYVLSTIATLRRTGRDKEANLLTIRLLENRQTSKADHFLLRNCPSLCVGSNEMIKNLLASSEPEKLAAMPKILEHLSTDSNNHVFLQDLLPRYIRKCNQPTLWKEAIHSRCIFAAVLAKNASIKKAISILKEAEKLLYMFLKKSIDSQRPLELSTLKLARCLAFTFGDANDSDTCVSVLNTLLRHMILDKDNDVHNGYGFLVCNFLKSTASQLHKKGFCEQSRAWINQTFLTSQTLFGDNHECTKRIHDVMLTCDWETFFLMNDLSEMTIDALYVE